MPKLIGPSVDCKFSSIKSQFFFHCPSILLFYQNFFGSSRSYSHDSIGGTLSCNLLSFSLSPLTSANGQTKKSVFFFLKKRRTIRHHLHSFAVQESQESAKLHLKCRNFRMTCQSPLKTVSPLPVHNWKAIRPFALNLFSFCYFYA